jgi:hypothetical protein
MNGIYGIEPRQKFNRPSGTNALLTPFGYPAMNRWVTILGLLPEFLKFCP